MFVQLCEKINHWCAHFKRVHFLLWIICLSKKCKVLWRSVGKCEYSFCWTVTHVRVTVELWLCRTMCFCLKGVCWSAQWPSVAVSVICFDLIQCKMQSKCGDVIESRWRVPWCAFYCSVVITQGSRLVHNIFTRRWGGIFRIPRDREKSKGFWMSASSLQSQSKVRINEPCAGLPPIKLILLPSRTDPHGGTRNPQPSPVGSLC